MSIEPELTEVLLKKKITTIAYETIQKEDGTLPLLKPMSEIAGLISIQLASRFLQNCNGGIGKLLGGVPGVHPAEIVIIEGIFAFYWPEIRDMEKLRIFVDCSGEYRLMRRLVTTFSAMWCIILYIRVQFFSLRVQFYGLLVQ